MGKCRKINKIKYRKNRKIIKNNKKIVKNRKTVQHIVEHSENIYILHYFAIFRHILPYFSKNTQKTNKN